MTDSLRAFKEREISLRAKEKARDLAENMDTCPAGDGSWTVYDQQSGDDIETGFQLEIDAWHWINTRHPLA